MVVNSEGGGPVHELAEGLRSLRKAAGLSTRELGSRINKSSANISYWERGERLLAEDTLESILHELGTTGEERDRLIGLRRQAEGPGRLVAGTPTIGSQLRDLIKHEQRAHRITEVSPLLVPGLLQTPDYVRAILRDMPDADTRVALRIGRQEVVKREHDPVEFHALIDSEVLVRAIAPPSVMAGQLRYLLEMSRRPNVHIQILPSTRLQHYSPMWAGPFILLEFPTAQPIVHLEHYRASATLWEAHDVISFTAAAEEIRKTAMTSAESTEVIEDIVNGMETTT